MEPDIISSKGSLILSLQPVGTPVSALALLAPREPSLARTYEFKLCEALLRSRASRDEQKEPPQRLEMTC